MYEAHRNAKNSEAHNQFKRGNFAESILTEEFLISTKGTDSFGGFLRDYKFQLFSEFLILQISSNILRNQGDGGKITRLQGEGGF